MVKKSSLLLSDNSTLTVSKKEATLNGHFSRLWSSNSVTKHIKFKSDTVYLIKIFFSGWFIIIIYFVCLFNWLLFVCFDCLIVVNTYVLFTLFNYWLDHLLMLIINKLKTGVSIFLHSQILLNCLFRESNRIITGVCHCASIDKII